MDGWMDWLIDKLHVDDDILSDGRSYRDGTGLARERETETEREMERERPKEGKAEPMMRVVSETNGLVSCRLAVSCQILHLSRE